MSLERFVLEHGDGDSSLHSSEVPRMEKGNKCLHNSCDLNLYYLTQYIKTHSAYVPVACFLSLASRLSSPLKIMTRKNEWEHFVNRVLVDSRIIQSS